MTREATAAQLSAARHPTYGLILFWVDRATNSRAAKRNNWPGLPIGQIPLACTSELNAALRDGVVEIIERPRVTDPARMARFVHRVPDNAPTHERPGHDV